ncbi:MAG: hypothetical protein ACKVX7_12585 [Planctomycetota bacterium]
MFAFVRQQPFDWLCSNPSALIDLKRAEILDVLSHHGFPAEKAEDVYSLALAIDLVNQNDAPRDMLEQNRPRMVGEATFKVNFITPLGVKLLERIVHLENQYPPMAPIAATVSYAKLTLGKLRPEEKLELLPAITSNLYRILIYVLKTYAMASSQGQDFEPVVRDGSRDRPYQDEVLTRDDLRKAAGYSKESRKSLDDLIARLTREKGLPEARKAWVTRPIDYENKDSPVLRPFETSVWDQEKAAQIFAEVRRDRGPINER